MYIIKVIIIIIILKLCEFQKVDLHNFIITSRNVSTSNKNKLIVKSSRKKGLLLLLAIIRKLNLGKAHKLFNLWYKISPLALVSSLLVSN